MNTLKMILILSVTVLSFSAAKEITENSSGDLPKVSLDPSAWTMTDGAAIEDGVLRLTGDKSKYCRAETKITFTPKADAREIYFICDLKMNDLDYGEKAHMTPKLKIYDEGKKPKKSENIKLSPDTWGKWATYSVAYAIPKKGDTLVFYGEVGIQNCGGMVEAKNIRIAYAPVNKD